MTQNDVAEFRKELKRLFVGYRRNVQAEKQDTVREEISLYFEMMQQAFSLNDVRRSVDYLLKHHVGFYPTIADFFNALKVIRKRDAQIKAGKASERMALEYKESLKPVSEVECQQRIANIDNLLKALEGQMRNATK
jgi:hypothetical protein